MWRPAVRILLLRLKKTEGVLVGKEAFAALKYTWIIGTNVAKARNGIVHNRGDHRKPRRERPPSTAITRYHSGEVINENRPIGAPLYRDWNGAVPQVPW